MDTSAKRTAVITVLGDPDEVERRWTHSDWPEHSRVSFVRAPGDRGTEVRVDLSAVAGNRVVGAVKKVAGADPVANAKDQLRHFKARFETGEVARSDAVPEGETSKRKLKQRPAQPQAVTR